MEWSWSDEATPTESGQAPAQRHEGEEEKPSCHSDYVDDETAKRLQEEKLVQLNTAPAHNLPKHDSVI